MDASAPADDPACSKSSPCRTLETALQAASATRNIINVAAGNYSPSTSLTITVAITIRGPRRNSTTQPIEVTVDRLGQGHVIIVANDLTLEDIRITGTTGTLDEAAIRCHGNGPRLQLRRLEIRDNQRLGIDSDGCAVTLGESQILNNFGGGVSVQNAAFTIVNNFISGNGTGGTSVLATEFGGIRLVGIGAANTFAFNSVAGNNAELTSGISGVDCRTAGLRATSNIVFGNATNMSGELTPPGSCVWDHSIVSVTGSNNLDLDPNFVDAASGDLHIQSTSPARTNAASDTSVISDYDGQVRPLTSNTPDMGADEVE